MEESLSSPSSAYDSVSPSQQSESVGSSWLKDIVMNEENVSSSPSACDSVPPSLSSESEETVDNSWVNDVNMNIKEKPHKINRVPSKKVRFQGKEEREGSTSVCIEESCRDISNPTSSNDECQHQEPEVKDLVHQSELLRKETSKGGTVIDPGISAAVQSNLNDLFKADSEEETHESEKEENGIKIIESRMGVKTRVRSFLRSRSSADKSRLLHSFSSSSADSQEKYAEIMASSSEEEESPERQLIHSVASQEAYAEALAYVSNNEDEDEDQIKTFDYDSSQTGSMDENGSMSWVGGINLTKSVSSVKRGQRELAREKIEDDQETWPDSDINGKKLPRASSKRSSSEQEKLSRTSSRRSSAEETKFSRNSSKRSLAKETKISRSSTEGSSAGETITSRRTRIRSSVREAKLPRNSSRLSTGQSKNESIGKEIRMSKSRSKSRRSSSSGPAEAVTEVKSSIVNEKDDLPIDEKSDRKLMLPRTSSSHISVGEIKIPKTMSRRVSSLKHRKQSFDLSRESSAKTSRPSTAESRSLNKTISWADEVAFDEEDDDFNSTYKSEASSSTEFSEIASIKIEDEEIGVESSLESKSSSANKSNSSSPTPNDKKSPKIELETPLNREEEEITENSERSKSTMKSRERKSLVKPKKIFGQWGAKKKQQQQNKKEGNEKIEQKQKINSKKSERISEEEGKPNEEGMKSLNVAKKSKGKRKKKVKQVMMSQGIKQKKGKDDTKTKVTKASTIAAATSKRKAKKVVKKQGTAFVMKETVLRVGKSKGRKASPGFQLRTIRLKGQNDEDFEHDPELEGASVMRFNKLTSQGYISAEFPTNDPLNTPLHMACLTHYPEKFILDHLLKSNPEAITTLNTVDEMPLHYAVKDRKGVSRAVLDVLLEAFPDAVEYANVDGSLPIHLACQVGAPSRYAILRLLELFPDSVLIPNDLRVALDEEDDDDDIEAGNCLTDLMFDTFGFNWYGEGQARRKKYETGWSPLHLAAVNGAPPSTIEAILETNCETMIQKTSKGRTPIECAKWVIINAILNDVNISHVVNTFASIELMQSYAKEIKIKQELQIKGGIALNALQSKDSVGSWWMNAYDFMPDRNDIYGENDDEGSMDSEDRAMDNEKGLTPLHRAIMGKDDPEKVQELLEISPECMDIQSTEERTPLECAKVMLIKALLNDESLLTMHNTFIALELMQAYDEERDDNNHLNATTALSRANVEALKTKEDKQFGQPGDSYTFMKKFIAMNGSSLLGREVKADNDSAIQPKEFYPPNNLSHVNLRVNLPVGYRRIRRAILSSRSGFIPEAVMKTRMKYQRLVVTFQTSFIH